MKKTTRAVEAAPTETQAAEVSAQPAQEEAPAPAPEPMPSGGGSFVRQPDGSLKQEGKH